MMPIDGRLTIYGATGFSGRRIAEQAVLAGLSVTLAGRDRRRLALLGETLRCPIRPVALNDVAGLQSLVAECDVLVNAAGPFTDTGAPLVTACLSVGTHYLDIAGELPWFRRLESLSATAFRRGVMLMPGAGFVVAPSDCLAAHVRRRAHGGRRLRLAFSATDLYSRGSMRAMMRLVASEVAVRRHGQLTTLPVGRLERCFDYGDGPRLSSLVGWADLVTAYRSTGIPNIEVYVESSWWKRLIYQGAAWWAGPLQSRASQWAADSLLRMWPEGPSEARQEQAERVIIAEVDDPGLRTQSARLTLPDGYLITPRLCVAVAQEVCAGIWEPGFRTPAEVFGPELLRRFDDMTIQDLN